MDAVACALARDLLHLLRAAFSPIEGRMMNSPALTIDEHIYGLAFVARIGTETAHVSYLDMLRLALECVAMIEQYERFKAALEARIGKKL